ncbi:unnamed protein product, partial [Rotaria magnacalcarata]
RQILDGSHKFTDNSDKCRANNSLTNCYLLPAAVGSYVNQSNLATSATATLQHNVE